MKTLVKVVSPGFLALGIAPVAAHAATSCFHFRLIVTTATQTCTSYCTQCDFVGPTGEDEGADQICIDKEV